MKTPLRCVGYVKTMDRMDILDPKDRIPAIETDLQKQHIREYAEKNNMTLTRIYADEDENTAYFQLYEDAVHRKFDVLILETMYCFGRNAFAAGNFIARVLLMTGFQVIFLDCSSNVYDYIKECLAVSRITYSRIQYRIKFQNKTRGHEQKKKVKTELHELSFYEEKQKELFSKMLEDSENFDQLETEMKECRRIIKELRRKNGKKKQT